jgi:ribosomal protein S18 acetylase RimI-like enzyme
MFIRSATRADLPNLERMLRKAGKGPHLELPPPDDQDFWNLFEIYRYELWEGQGEGVVAEDDDTFAGAAWWRYFSQERPGLGFVGPDVPEITIGVEPTFQGLGLGRDLMAALIQRAHELNVPALSLNVEADNERAIRLYSRTGFMVVRTVAEDASLVMSLTLSDEPLPPIKRLPD